MNILNWNRKSCWHCLHWGWMEVARFPWTMSLITLCLCYLTMKSSFYDWLFVCVCVCKVPFLIFNFSWQVASGPVILLHKSIIHISYQLFFTHWFHHFRLAMELLDKRVRIHLEKTAAFFESMEGGMPSVQERLATLNEASECWNIEIWFECGNDCRCSLD